MSMLGAATSRAGYIETIAVRAARSGMGGAATAVADSASLGTTTRRGSVSSSKKTSRKSASQVVLPFVTQRSSAAEGGASHDITPCIYNVYFPGTFRVGVPGLVFDLGGGTTWGTAIEWDQDHEAVALLGVRDEHLRRDALLHRRLPHRRVGLLRQRHLQRERFARWRTVRSSATASSPTPRSRTSAWTLPFLRELLDSKNGVDDGKFEIQSDQEFPTGLAPPRTPSTSTSPMATTLGLLFRKPGVPFGYGIRIAT
ncbi:MAG: hypothetical protein U0610_04460 [bacterium]